MSVETVLITEEQKNHILALDEGHFVDVKAKDIEPAKLTRHISAFANADGGELYIGISENKIAQSKYWQGFANPEAANGHLQIFERLFPLGHDVSYTFLSCATASGLVLQIIINKTSDIKVASDGTPYIRRGAQSLPVNTAQALQRLQLNKGVTSFENEAIPVNVREITNSTHIIRFMIEIIPTAEPEPWLKKQQLIRDDKPTVAGIILFAEEPQAIIPKRCSIKIYRYQTTDQVGSRETLVFDPVTIEGCAYDQIKAAVSKTVEIVEGISVLTVSGLEKAKYPWETLHEIITNAVLHRDYSIADDIHVRIFDNRIEVESPGRLPAHITPKNILEERFARNGAVVRLINKFPDPPNKDVGEGLNTAFEAMRQLRLKDPVIMERDNSVLVQIRHEPLASPEEIITEYLRDNPQINNTKAREICYIPSENTMKRHFEKLMKMGLIERVPGRRGRASAYRLKQAQ